MPYTAEDYQRDFGPNWPDFYTTPTDWSKCKNLNLEGATPCWHPHCNCQPATKKRSAWADSWVERWQQDRSFYRRALTEVRVVTIVTYTAIAALCLLGALKGFGAI